jgi:hypothetical protein
MAQDVTLKTRGSDVLWAQSHEAVLHLLNPCGTGLVMQDVSHGAPSGHR